MESNKKIDNVYITHGGCDVEKFHINQLKEAQKKAKEMSEYHDDIYSVEIRNEYQDHRGFGFNCKPSEVETELERRKNL
jgi:hypothetical protein